MPRTLLQVSVAGLTVSVLAAAPAIAQGVDGEEVFERACAMCHQNPEPDSRAPALDGLRQYAPEAILTALTTGNMFRQGSELTEAERRAAAGFAAGRPVGTAPPVSNVGRCPSGPPALTASALERGWTGYTANASSTRFQPADRGGLTAPLVPRLTLKWAFGFPGVNSAKSQPTVAGGRLFVAAENGEVYALDGETGCTYWTFHAQAGIRSSTALGAYTAVDGTSGVGVFFADVAANAYALDAQTGEQIWSRKVDDHQYAGATGSPTYYDGRLYVVLSGVGEEGQGGRPGYACCTFRGSVTALDADDGTVVWKSYTIPESQPRGTSAEGQPLFGPAGGGIWGAPTIDPSRNAIYVTTGNGYAAPQQPTTDAVLALDMATGALKWSFQPIANDLWTGGCRPGNSGNNPNCPDELGPDLDFSMSPALTRRSDGRDILIVLQKSGMAYALEPDDGALVWEYRTSQGSGMGGQWGITTDGNQAYFGVNGTRAKVPGGMRAVNIDTGQQVWTQEAAEPLCGDIRGCSSAQGASLTGIPGVVFSGSMDGGLRAYAAEDGSVIWQFDTNREFETVNGVPANGGAMDGPGAVVADGMLYIGSGYVSLIGRPGNVLLAFGVED